MRKLLVIGIGSGDPEHVTVQAIRALNRVRVFFVADKGRSKDALVQLRREICERYIEHKTYRIIELRDPVRDPAVSAYAARVEAWHAERAQLLEAALEQELGEDECGGFLVWGDPSLYDSTLRILERILVRGRLQFEIEVIPGISSPQVLAARHHIALNRIGGSLHITTGRRLSEGSESPPEDVLVMLDGESSFQRVPEPEQVEIYWGAYLGTQDEILRAGKLSEVGAEIERVRREARAEHGWIMDTYLLRRSGHERE
jgi:precorrin-6A synthase